MTPRDKLLALASQERKREPSKIIEGAYVVEMSGKEFDDYQASLVTKAGGKFVQDWRNTSAKLVARCLRDENNMPLIDVKKPDEIAQLGSIPSSVLSELANECRKINGMTEEEQEGLEGESEGENDLTSDSPND